MITLPGGTRARLRPVRARCWACGRNQVLLPGWCAPRRAHGIAVIATAAGAALQGTGHRVIGARLGVAAGTVRGWLRRLRARAEPLRCHATRQLAFFDPHAWVPGPAGSPSRTRSPRWPLLGTLGLGHALMPAPGSSLAIPGITMPASRRQARQRHSR